MSWRLPRLTWGLAALILGLLAGCGTVHRAPREAQGPSASNSTYPPVVQKRGGGYYQDDGPGESQPPNLEQTPDAVPRDEPALKTAANRPYVVFGKTYTPTVATQSFRQRGVASWYGRKFHGQRTSSGEAYDMYGMSAAHPTLPIPSYVRVTNLANGRAVVVRVNDRGPFLSDRIIDLSYTAALKLGYVNQGSTQVEIEQVRPGAVSPPPSSPPVLLAGAPSAPPAPPVAAAPEPIAIAPPAPAVPVPASAVAPAADVAPVALPTSSQPDGVYLQLGAFGAREGAEEFRIKVYQQLNWLTETVYIVARDRLFRVQLGPYKDRAEAAVVAGKIRDALQFAPMFILK